MEEEVIRLDVKKAREEGFEYHITCESHPVTLLSDQYEGYTEFCDIIIITKRCMVDTIE